jgi:tetratricopeptide (TPR) repeat protein
VPLRQRVPEQKLPVELDTLVMQMLAKNPAERPQSMAVVEAMLCDAQIAARLQTDWDDLELPLVDEAWQKKLADGMPSPRSRRMRRRAIGLGVVALVGLSLALYFGLRRPKTIVAYTPVYVEVTKTDEAEAVAPWLRKASIAAAAEKFLVPANESALHFIEQAEAEAKKVGASSNGASSLRQLYGNQFRSLGNSLHDANLNDLATLRYREALRFLPGDGDLRNKVGVPGTRSQGDKANEPRTGTTPRTQEDPAGAAAADLFSAVSKGQFSRARISVTKLLDADKQGTHSARLADEFRKRADGLWEAGKHDEARPYYEIVSELDGKDSLARERASNTETVEAAPTPDEGDEAPTVAKPGKRRIDEDKGGPKDHALSTKAAKEGSAALSRGDLAKAQAAFQRAVNADPTNPDALFGMAEVAFENARYTDALDYGRKAMRLQPKNPRYQVVVGDSYFKLLRHEEARNAYRRAQALAPKDSGIAARLERVEARLAK